MTNPDRPNLVSSETLERLRTAGFSEHETTTCWRAHTTLLRRRSPATPSPATPQPAAAPSSGPKRP